MSKLDDLKTLRFDTEHVLIVYPYMATLVQSKDRRLSPYAAVNIESKYIYYDNDNDKISLFVSDFIAGLFGYKLKKDDIERCKDALSDMRDEDGVDIVEEEAVKFLDHILLNLEETHLSTAIIIPPSIKMSVEDQDVLLSGLFGGADYDEPEPPVYEDEDYEFN